MKAVILAAGMGKRLRPYTESIPKGLVEVGDKTLLEHSLDKIAMGGLEEVIIITGHLGNKIEEKIGLNYANLSISYVENKEFNGTGSMHSLLKARELLEGHDILLLESDLIYEKDAIHSLLKSSEADVMLVGKSMNAGDDVYVHVNDLGHVVNIGKEIDPGVSVGSFVGISKFSSSFLSQLFDQAEEHYNNGRKDEHYEVIAFEMSQSKNPIYTKIEAELHWTEIDNEADLINARSVIYPRIQEKDGTN